MRRSIVKPLLLLILLLIAVTASPNASSAEPLKDDRLDQKVSYTGGYKRLHTVLEDLSKSTKVTFRCGKNKDDWRVRDVPVIVFTKDLPLGTLLRALADATHTQLARTETSSGPPTYSLYRTAAMEKDVTFCRDAKVSANKALANWAWGTLISLADFPDEVMSSGSSGKIDPREYGLKRSKQVGKILKSLNPEAKKKILSGESLVIPAGESTYQPMIKEWLTTDAKQPTAVNRNVLPFTAAMPTDVDVRGASIKISQDLRTGELHFELSNTPVISNSDGSRFYNTACADSVMLADAAAYLEDPNLPKKPAVDPNAKPQERYLRDMVVLEKKEDWSLPALQRKIEIKLPVKKHITREELFRTIFDFSGLNIVCEDFANHKGNTDGWPKTGFGSDPTIAVVIRAGNVPAQGDGLWFYSEKDKLMIGWAGDWRKHHTSLVPEALFSGLKEKIRATGADIDDICPLVWLSNDQMLAWLSGVPEFMGIESLPYESNDRCFWKLYDKLKPEEKLLAKSPDGLKLSSLDPAWLWDFMRLAQTVDTGEIASSLTFGHFAYPEYNKTISSPSEFSDLTIRVVREPLQSWMTACMVGEDTILMGEVNRSNSVTPHYSCRLDVVDRTNQKALLQLRWYATAFPLQYQKKKLGPDGKTLIPDQE